MKHILTQPFFVNILPFSPGNEKKVADCAKDYAAKTGNKIVLYMLIMDVEYPAEKKIAHAVESYRKLKKELADSDLQLGVLIQSILGHVPRGHKKFEPWTRTRDIDGKNVRYCILDPRMQDYPCLLHLLNWQAGSLPPAAPGKSFLVNEIQESLELRDFRDQLS